MARITARQAYTRSQTRRLDLQERRREQKRETTLSLIKARDKYVRQLKDIGVLNRNVYNLQMPLPTSKGADDLSPFGSQQSKKSTGSSTKGKIGLKKAAEGNKKITDYYAVTSKDRENFPSTNLIKSSSKASSRSLLQKTRRSSRRDEIEIITISDDEDEDTDVSRRRNDESNSNMSVNQNIVKMEIPNISSPFKDLNISVKVDEDIEIVEMLPPIALRDHPIVDLEVDE